jgi:hypothetical protein
MFGKFKGYKTYMVAGLAVAGAAVGYLVGDVPAMEAAKIAFEAVVAATLRSAIG